MELAIIGLGRMGGNMARRLVQRGHRVVGYSRTRTTVEEYVPYQIVPAYTPEEVVQALTPCASYGLCILQGHPPSRQSFSLQRSSLQAI